MSAVLSELAVLYIDDRFGKCTAAVADCLLHRGPAPLPVLLNRTKLTVRELRRSLCTLVQFDLCVWTAQDNGRLTYRFNVRQLEHCLLTPRCILVAKQLFGDLAEQICEILALNGKLTAEDLCAKCCAELNQEHDLVRACVQQLVDVHFIRRAAQMATNELGHVQMVVPDVQFAHLMLPQMAAAAKSTKSVKTDGRKRRHSSTEQSEEEQIHWQIDFERFRNYFRDEVVLELIGTFADEASVQVVQRMLKINELKSTTQDKFSNTITANEVMRPPSNAMSGPGTKEQQPIPKSAISQRLQYLAEDQNRIIRQPGDSSGGIFTIDFEHSLELACRGMLQLIIKEKFDTTGLRIFNLLIKKQYLEQNEIEKCAMMPSKEGKLQVYQLLTAGYIQVKDVSSTTDFAPVKTFYLFEVDMKRIARTHTDLCYKVGAYYNRNTTDFA